MDSSLESQVELTDSMLRVRAAQRLTNVINPSRQVSFNFDSIQQQNKQGSRKESLALRLARLKSRTNSEEEIQQINLADPSNAGVEVVQDARFDTERNKHRYTMIDEIKMK